MDIMIRHFYKHEKNLCWREVGPPDTQRTLTLGMKARFRPDKEYATYLNHVKTKTSPLLAALVSQHRTGLPAICISCGCIYFSLRCALHGFGDWAKEMTLYLMIPVDKELLAL